MHQTGDSDASSTLTSTKFSDQMWGETSQRYAKSVRKLTKAKLNEVINAAHAYLKVKGQCGPRPSKGSYDTDDDKDEHALIVASSDDIQIAENGGMEGEHETTGGEESMTESETEPESEEAFVVLTGA